MEAPAPKRLEDLSLEEQLAKLDELLADSRFSLADVIDREAMVADRRWEDIPALASPRLARRKQGGA